MVKPTIDALTATVPQLGQAPAEFDANTNDFLPQLVPLQDQINLMIDWVEDTATAVDDNAAAALISEAEAENAAFDANQSADEAADSAALAISGGAAAAGADVHVPNAAYTASNPASAAVSNVDGQTYRCILAHSGVATDPANDATRWVRISFSGDYDDLNGGPAIASEGQAEAGENNTALMTPLRTAQALAVNLSGFDVFVDEFFLSGTWTKRENAAFVFVELLGAGDGGASGRSQTASSFNITYAGAGGKGGNYVEALLSGESLPSLVVVTIGAGGLGQNHPTAILTTSAPAPNTAGGHTSFGDMISTLLVGDSHAVPVFDTSLLAAVTSRDGSSGSYRDTGTDAPDSPMAGGSGGGGGAGYSYSNSSAKKGNRGGITTFKRSGVDTLGGGGAGGEGAASVDGAHGVAFGEGGGGGSCTSGWPTAGGKGGNGGIGAGGGGAGSAGTDGSSTSRSWYVGTGGDGGDGWARITTLVMRSTQE